jgi:hypothetical protein
MFAIDQLRNKLRESAGNSLAMHSVGILTDKQISAELRKARSAVLTDYVVTVL